MKPRLYLGTVGSAALRHVFATARSIVARTEKKGQPQSHQMFSGSNLPLYIFDPDGYAFELHPGLDAIRPAPEPALPPPPRHPMMPSHNLLWHPADGFLGGADTPT